MSHGLLLATLALFAGAAIVPLLSARLGRASAAWGASATMAVSALLVAPLAPEAARGGLTVQRLEWLPEWGLDLAFRLDGLALLFAILILGIGQLIVLYAAYYMPEKDPLARLMGLLLAFAGGMLGVVLSENLLLLVFFWEVTSVSSFLLIAYKQGDAEARSAARLALALTGGGGLALLGGVLLLGRMVGSYELSDVLASGELIRAHPLYTAALGLVLLGAFTKSAQFPFHVWLPSAMAAPTPVSAYLHSATMVKAGIFLLARLHPALSGTDLWFSLVGGAGAVTLLWGAYVALTKHDLKGLLAYSTVSHLGLVTLLLGLDTPQSPVAAIFHIVNHATFKASLFMAAGIIDHETGTRDMRRLGGLRHSMPVTATLGIVAAAAMAGVPLLNGFLSKEMFFTEATAHPGVLGMAFVMPLFATMAGLLSVAYSIRFVHDVFLGPPAPDLPRAPHEPPRWMRAPVELLVVLCVLVGFLPQLLVGWLVWAAADATVGGGLPDYYLAVWHGFNLPLAMSVVALVGGVAYYRYRRVLYAAHERWGLGVSALAAFEGAVSGLARASGALLALGDSGRLRRYLGLVVLAALAAGALGWWGAGPSALAGGGPRRAPDLAAFAALAALLFGVAGTVLLHRRRVMAVVFVSVVGLMVSLTFVRFSAPDLALTQLSVEVVTIALLLLALRYLPAEGPAETPAPRRLGHGLVAAAGGAGVGLLAYAMMTRPFEPISGWFLANAVEGGGGTNVVNVILVDFRGFDTLGEVTVLAIAALGAQALLEGLRLRPHAATGAPESDRYPIMLAMLMRPLLPLGLVAAFYILLRGHNLPGGGFIAGLMTGVILALQYVAAGLEVTTARLRADGVRLFAAGLGLSVLTGLVSMAYGYPFLTSTHGYVSIPLVGRTHLASALVFDVGIYLVVVATVLVVLSELGRLSQREVAPAAEPAPLPRPALGAVPAGGAG